MMTVATYFSYLALAVPLTIWVATTLSRNGRVFLADVFDGNAELAGAVNRLLVVGFYLLNLGFVTLYLRVGAEVLTVRQLIEVLSVKLGIVMLVLGVLHFLNVYVFNAIRRRSRMEQLRTAPVAPQGYLPQAHLPGGFPAPGR
jgi:cytochrome c biogenesis protein CcdA